MVGTSKILTVSYGTFSCTLEGFDDSFSTMKAIAEYFRGLAADDRYFGAEPPTPDAEMLAKIAEREISRRVDATMNDGEIVLRAAALSDQSDGAKSGDKVHDETSRAEVDAARKAAKAARKAEKAAQKAARKAEAKAAKEAEKEATRQAEAEANAANQTDDDTPSSAIPATAEDAEGTTGPDTEEARNDAPSSTLAESVPAPETIVPAHPDPNSIAAKLQRIRAVVGTSEDTPSDDLTSQFLPQSDTPDVSDAEDDAQIDSSTDPVADFEAHTAEIENADQDDADEAPSTDAPDMIARVMAQQSETDSGDAATQEGDESEAVSADAFKFKPVKEDDASDAEDSDAAAADKPAPRVIRMKRADFEKAVENGDMSPAKASLAPTGPDFGLLDGADDLDDYLEDSDFAEDATGLDDADLAQDLKAITEDSEASDDTAQTELHNADDDVADTDADVRAEDDTPEEPSMSSDAEKPLTPARAFLADDPQVDEAALDRLMSETDVQMQEPAGSRRRDAIAHLKAAVAAKQAARQVGEPEDDGQDVENAFRNDLTEAVRPEGTAPRPRPVVRGEARTERPRPTPLKLVPAQRIDLPAAEKRDGPVVPRRVEARKDEAEQQRAAGSFAEFADNMGATELPDLLEAAAAYTAFVEGADEFSRPQILRRVRAVAADDFNREDGLRSFADLLRSGRFTKVRNGRFQVADDSRYNPESRAS